MKMARPLILGKNRRKNLVTLPSKARATHMHVVGDSNKGKSKFLEGLIRQDIADGNGLCLIDPHGTLYNNILTWCARNRRVLGRRKIRLLDLSQEGWAFGFNPLQNRYNTDISVRVDAMVGACAQVWSGEDTSRTPRLLKCLRALAYCLISKELTLLEAINLMSSTDSDGIRKYLTANISDSIFKSEWAELNAKNQRDFSEYFESTTNRLMEFLSAETIRNVIGQKEGIDFKQCMDDGEVVLVNLSAPKKLSVLNQRLLGTLIVNELFLTAHARDERSKPFYLYIDECHQFLNDDIAGILDETRKFGLHAILSHQRLGQLRNASLNVYNAVMGQAQTKIVFGTNDVEDAELMASNIFTGEFNLNQSKAKFDKPVVIDYKIEWLSSESDSVGASAFESESIGSGVSAGEVMNEEGVPITSSASEGSQQSDTKGFTSSNTHSSGRHQVLRPVHKMMPTVPETFEEVVYKATARLKNLPPRFAVMKTPERHSVGFKTSDITPVYVSENILNNYVQSLLNQSSFSRPLKDVTDEIDARGKALLQSAKQTLLPPEPVNFKEPIRKKS